VLPEPAVNTIRLTVVNESPSRADIAEGKPMAGASGKMLQRGLKTIGLRREDVHWTSAVLCDCEPRDLPAARKACANRLVAELAAAKPPITMTLGAFGLQSVLGKLGPIGFNGKPSNRKPQALKWRGSINPRKVGGFETILAPTIHPDFARRAPQWGPVLELDVARIGRVMQSGFRPPEAHPDHKLVIARDYYNLQNYLGQLRGQHVGFDVETVGLGPTHTSLVCFALSDGKLTIVVPWSQESNGLQPWWSDPPKIAALVSAALANHTTVTHNGPAFDHIVARRYGLQIADWDDSLLATHVIAGHMPKRLQHVVTMHLDVSAWKEADHASTIEQLWFYNAQDTLYTIQAWKALKGQVGR
jgi:uracil-DNA glycosylase family 4